MSQQVEQSVTLQPGDTIRKLPPGRYRKDPDVWELRRNGRVVGRVESAQLGSKSLVVFFHAFAIHPTTGRTVNLDLSTDFAERVEGIFAYIDHLEATPNKR